ncbi:MAG: tetratricopeptide repeat protein, partial [Candidatus Sumerlaeia bacterium]|nr:tetratricopeptide repeat protein [Candidatus Sumerlaeia bacterium]
YDEAERNFLKVLELQPNNLAVRRGLIEVYTETHQEERRQEQIVALVDALLANQQFEECINYCLQLLEKNPDDLELREKLTAAYRGAGNLENFVGELMNLADIYIERGNYEGALKMYQQIASAEVDIIDVHPHQVQVLVALGRTEEAINRTLAYAEKLIAKNEYEAALHAYREIIDLDDSRDDIREQFIYLALKLPLTEERIVSCARVADELIRRGMLVAAATALEKLRDRVPRNIFVLEKLSEIYAQQGLAEKVLETQRQLIACLIERREFARAHQLINALLSSYPSNPEIYLLLAELNEAEENIEATTTAYKQAIELYRQQNKLDEALRIYDKLSEIYPDDLSIKEAQMHLYIEAGKNEAGFAKCMELISILEQRQETTGLLRILNFALSLVPSATDLWLKMAELQRSAGNVAEAKSAYFKAHQLFLDSGNTTTAIAQLQKILELDSDDVPALRAMAVIQHSLGDEVLSLKHYKRAADLLFTRGELGECEEVLRQILNVVPDDLTALNRLAEVYESLHQTEALKEIWQKLIHIYKQRSAFGRVLEICQKFIELEPASIFALENMATAYEQTQNLESAIDCYFRLAHIYATKQEPEFQQLMLETILEKQPAQTRARQELIELLVDTGRTEEAIKHISELTDQYKQSENYDVAAKFLLQLLERLPEDKRLHLLLLTVYEEAGKKESGFLNEGISEAEGQEVFRRILKSCSRSQ